jgi:hypothetical protein
MKKLLIFFVVQLCIFFLFYIGGVFIHADFNIKQWDSGNRTVIGSFCLVGCIMSLMPILLSKQFEK